MPRRKRCIKEIGLDVEVVKKRRLERKQCRKESKYKSQKTKLYRQLHYNTQNGGIKTGYRNQSQSISVLLPLNSDTCIEKEYYSVKSAMKRNDEKMMLEMSMNIPILQYLDYFWNWLQKGKLPIPTVLSLFPNTKEITESVAAFVHIRPFLSKINVVLVIGDGSKPRTGALFAMMCPGKVIFSIDPNMKQSEICDNITNLHPKNTTIEQFLEENPSCFDNISNGIAIVCVHSHANFDHYMPQLFLRLLLSPSLFVAIYALKCCGIYQSFTMEQLNKYKLKLQKEGVDFAVQSPERNFTLWTS